MRTWIAKTEDVKRKWHIVDAQGKSVGRMATQIAEILRGKNKPTYTPHADTGDFVIVINAKDVTMTGSKWDEKIYYKHSRFFGSLKEFKAKEMRERDAAFILMDAVKGMLPRTKLGKAILKKLKVYEGAEHPHAVQRPEALTLTNT
jgi:large subunit ribosomal protein L13